jgi:hypothetical protein
VRLESTTTLVPSRGAGRFMRRRRARGSRAGRSERVMGRCRRMHRPRRRDGLHCALTCIPYILLHPKRRGMTRYIAHAALQSSLGTWRGGGFSGL